MVFTLGPKVFGGSLSTIEFAWQGRLPNELCRAKVTSLEQPLNFY